MKKIFQPKFYTKIQYWLYCVTSIIYYITMLYNTYFIKKEGMDFNLPIDNCWLFVICWFASIIALLICTIIINKKAYPDLKIFKHFSNISFIIKIINFALILILLINKQVLLYLIMLPILCDVILLIIMFLIIEKTSNKKIITLIKNNLINVNDKILKQYKLHRKKMYWLVILYIIFISGPAKYILINIIGYILVTIVTILLFTLILNKIYKLRYKKYKIKLIIDGFICLLINIFAMLLYFNIIYINLIGERTITGIAYISFLAIIPYWIQIRYCFIIMEHNKKKKEIKNWEESQLDYARDRI